MKIISMLPWADWLALITFFALWVGYAWLAKVRGLRDQSLIANTNRYRQMWMMQATGRDPRMLDGLKPKVRRAFLLAQCEGLSHKAIAEQMGISLRSVERYVADALYHCYVLRYES